MDHNSKSPILVTGSHRSGSTWVGKMLSIPKTVAYIHEPFNINHRPGICSCSFQTWFTYICDKNGKQYQRGISDTLKFKYKLWAELASIRSVKDALRMTRDFSLFSVYRLSGCRPLLKDPIAIFSVEWLARTYHMDVVILIRHPAAFIGSLKKANWSHEFAHFLKQEMLMENHLFPYRNEIEEYANTKKDIIDQGILLWNLIHYMISKYQDKNPSWIFVRHEDLSRDPITEFSILYKKLGITFSKPVLEGIKKYCFSSMKGMDKSALKRDSRANIMDWRKRLTSREISKIRDGTYEISSRFYSDKDWL